MKHHWTHPTKGAMWTRKHKPIRVQSIDTYSRKLSVNQMALLEDQKTLKYAALYGFESVRGGGYCQQYPKWPMTVTPIAKQKRRHKKNQAEQQARRELRASAKILGL